MMKPVAVSLFLLLIFSGSSGQDPHFSQFQNNSLFLNPSRAGSDLGGRAAAGFRWQWPKLQGDYKTTYFSYDHLIHAIRGGLGAYYYNDASGQGTFKSNKAGLMYSPSFALFSDTSGASKLVIKPGIEAAFGSNSIDWDKLTFGDMIDPRRGFVFTSNEQNLNDHRNYFDLSAGLTVVARRFTGGFAVHHLTEPDVGIVGIGKLPMRFTFHASGLFGRIHRTNPHLEVVPSLVYMQQQDFRLLLVNAIAKYDRYSLGAGLRLDDALLFYAGYEWKDFHFAYSYDLTISDLTNQTGGAHELGVQYRFAYARWEKKLPGTAGFLFY